MIEVLDQGYVELVDLWGSDEAFIEAARMSTDKGFEGWDKDAKLLAYLYNNKHSTPFEMGGMVIEVKAPIFVFREWHRHRTQCLAGDTDISFELPDRARRGVKTAKKLKLGELYRKWSTDSPVKRKDKQGRSMMQFNRERISKMSLRVYDETAEKFVIGHIADITSGGVKPVFEVALKNGKRVTCSKDHRLLTTKGWKTLESCGKGDELLCNGTYHTEEGTRAIRLARSGEKSNFWRGGVTSDRGSIAKWTSGQAPSVHKKFDYTCQDCSKRGGRLHAHHLLPVVTHPELGRDFENLVSLCESCHYKAHGRLGDGAMTRAIGRFLLARPSKILSIKLAGERETFDISVSGENHNFVANGIVVHNSYNEMSARYIPLPDENYVPSVERLMLGANTSTTNKQAQGNGETLGLREAMTWQADLEEAYAACQRVYEKGIAAGVPKEIARLSVPVARYSRMRASANIRNWLGFLTLRQAPAAQWEIREYANAVGKLISETFPRTWALFEKEHK